MQSAEAERIVVVVQDDPEVRTAAGKWYQMQGFSVWDRRFVRVSSIASVVILYLGTIALGGVIGALVGMMPALATWPTVFVGAFVAWVAAHRWLTWSAGLARKVHDAHATGGWGQGICEFDPRGFAFRDAQRAWRNDWRGIALAECRADGSFLAAKGPFFHVPSTRWHEPSQRRTEARTIVGWWRAATPTPGTAS